MRAILTPALTELEVLSIWSVILFPNSEIWAVWLEWCSLLSRILLSFFYQESLHGPLSSRAILHWSPTSLKSSNFVGHHKIRHLGRQVECRISQRCDPHLTRDLQNIPQLKAEYKHFGERATFISFYLYATSYLGYVTLILWSMIAIH